MLVMVCVVVLLGVVLVFIEIYEDFDNVLFDGLNMIYLD